MPATGAYSGHYPLQDLSLICTSPELIPDLKNTSATSHCAVVEENVSVLFFPFYLTYVFTVGSELEIQNQKMHRKKWQHIAIFCFTGLVSCVKGKAILVVLHPSGAFIVPNPERTEWICFPESQIYESSIYFYFFPKLAVQENHQKKKKKKKKKRRSSSDSSFAQHKQSNLRPLTCSSKPKQPRPLADQTFTDKTITRKQRSRGSSE
jgi:hypothetical protein